jgi:hypothetical protein
MKRHLPFALTAVICLSGCCSLRNPDKLPTLVRDRNDIRYKLLAHCSIQQKIDAENGDANHLHLFNQGLHRRFPEDRKLVDYLKDADKRFSQMHTARIKELDGVQADLARCHGELYLYESFNSDFDANYVNTNDPVGADLVATTGAL